MGMVALFTPVNQEAHFSRTSLLGLKKGRTSVRLSTAVDDLMDAAYEGSSSVDIDKAWDMLHRCLNGGKAEPLRATLAAKAIYGDANVEADGEAMMLVSKETVQEVAPALLALDDTEIARLLATLDPDDVYCMNGEDDLEYVIQGLNTLRGFYKSAAEAKDAVVVVIA